MAFDIQAAISGVDVKNGTIVVGATFTGAYATLNTSVTNSPTINSIQEKYDNKFDDPTYPYDCGC